MDCYKSGLNQLTFCSRICSVSCINTNCRLLTDLLWYLLCFCLFKLLCHMRYDSGFWSLFIDIYYGVIVVHLFYNSVVFVATLDRIFSSSRGSFVRLSRKKFAPVPWSLSSTIFRLSSYSGIFCIKYHVLIVALVACLETISLPSQVPAI